MGRNVQNPKKKKHHHHILRRLLDGAKKKHETRKEKQNKKKGRKIPIRNTPVTNQPCAINEALSVRIAGYAVTLCRETPNQNRQA